MINNARNLYDSIDFFLTSSANLPFPNETFDVVFNSFVLCDIASKEELVMHFKEMNRVCTKKGVVISVINSDFLFKKNWFSINTNFPENQVLKSGTIAKIYLTDVNIILQDYFWFEQDYIECFLKSGFSKIKIHRPLGVETDGYPWISELNYAPFCVYLCQK